jgi:hypothetical protein
MWNGLRTPMNKFKVLLKLKRELWIFYSKFIMWTKLITGFEGQKIKRKIRKKISRN